MASSTTQRQGDRDRRIALAAGVVAFLIALVPLGLGAALVGTHTTQRDGDGFYASGAHHIATPTNAFVSDTLDVDADGAGWVTRKGRLGTIRVTASGTTREPVFVGIARTTQVDNCLRGVAHDTIDDFDLGPFSIDTMRHAGTVTPPAPTSRSIWSKSAAGPGRQSISWPVEKGDWAVVVMNADGSPGVATDVSVGAKLGLLLWIGIGLLAVGAVFLVSAFVIVLAGRRRPPGAAPAKTPTVAVDGALS